MAVNFIIGYDHEPVFGSQYAYGIVANNNFAFMCDVWVFRIGPWWVLWD